MIDQESKEAILRQIERESEELVELLRSLIRIPSVNPTYPGECYEDLLGIESEVNRHLQTVLAGMGMETDLWEEETGRANLVGRWKGFGPGRSLLFNGHVDVVPAGPINDWTLAGPWSGERVGNRIVGRGACDMKGGIAAAIIALRAIQATGLRTLGDVLLEWVVGEEMMDTAAGTGSALKRGYRADGAIVVEPSAPPYRLGILPVSPGAYYLAITIPGKAGHASMRDELVRAGGLGDEIGAHSIDKALIIYEALRRLEEEWGRTKKHPLFTRPGHFTIHPGVITGGPSGPFVISSESRIECAVFHDPQDPPEVVRQEIEDQVMRFAQTDPWLREHPPVLEWLLWWPPYDLPIDHPLCRETCAAYQEALGETPQVYGFVGNNDAAFLNRGGIPAITLGPGDLRRAHAPNESVDIEDLVDAARIYALLIAGWCGLSFNG